MRRCYTPFTRYNRLSAGCTIGLTTVLNEQPMLVQPFVKPGCTTGLTTGCIHDTAGCVTVLTTGCIVYANIQPFVKPVQPVLTKGCIV